LPDLTALRAGCVLVLLLAATTLAAAGHANALAGAGWIPVSEAARLSLGIETVSVERADLHDGVTLTGRVILPPNSQWPVVAPADMVVTATLVLPGQVVAEGAPIQRVYSPALAMALSEFDILRMEAGHAAELAERAEALLAAGLTTAEDAHERALAAIAARTDVEAARPRFSGWQADEAAAHFVVLSPTDGVVSQLRTESGTRFSAGEPVFSLSTGRELWAQVAVPSRFAATLEAGGAIRVDGASATGRILAVDATLDPVTRAHRVHVALPSDFVGAAGALVDVVFLESGQAGTVSLPARSLVRIGGADHVFIDRGDRFEALSVELVQRTRDRVTIGAVAISAGDQVAISGLAALKNIYEGE